MTERPWKIRYVALAAGAMIGLWAGLAHAEERRLPYEARTQRSCHHMQSSGQVSGAGGPLRPILPQ